MSNKNSDLERIVEKNYLAISDFMRDYDRYMQLLTKAKIEDKDKVISQIIVVENKTNRVLEAFSEFGKNTTISKDNMYYDKLKDIFFFREKLESLIYDSYESIKVRFLQNTLNIKEAEKIRDMGLIRKIRQELNYDLLQYKELRNGIINKKILNNLYCENFEEYSTKIGEMNDLSKELDKIKGIILNTAWSEQNIIRLDKIQEEITSERSNTLIDRCKKAEFYEGVLMCEELNNDIMNSKKYLLNEDASKIISKLEQNHTRLTDLNKKINEAKNQLFKPIIKGVLITSSILAILGVGGIAISDYLMKSEARKNSYIKKIEAEAIQIDKEMAQKKIFLYSLDSTITYKQWELVNLDRLQQNILDPLGVQNLNKPTILLTNNSLDNNSGSILKDEKSKNPNNFSGNQSYLTTVNETNYSNDPDPNIIRLQKFKDKVDYVLYINKEDNQTSLYQIGKEGVKNIYSCNSSDGINQGNKVKQGDHKTPEGVFGIESIIKYRTESLFGAGKIRINTGYYGILFCGADYSDRINAINNKRDCTNGGIIVNNQDFLNISNTIGGAIKKTLVVIESPSRYKVI